MQIDLPTAAVASSDPGPAAVGVKPSDQVGGDVKHPISSLCLGWPDRSRNVSPYFLGHPDRIGPKGVVTMLVEIA